MIKKKDPIKGAQLKATPVKKLEAGKKVKVDASESKSQLAKMAKEKKASRRNTALLAAGSALVTGGTIAYETYHSNLRNKYDKANLNKRQGYGATPTNKQLRQWKKGQ